jgi:hypothetical protein
MVSKPDACCYDCSRTLPSSGSPPVCKAIADLSERTTSSRTACDVTALVAVGAGAGATELPELVVGAGAGAGAGATELPELEEGGTMGC